MSTDQFREKENAPSYSFNSLAAALSRLESIGHDLDDDTRNNPRVRHFGRQVLADVDVIRTQIIALKRKA